MAAIKLTKNEQKKQKDDLKRYIQYLPTLILKKQQLQMELVKILHEEELFCRKKEEFLSDIQQWIDVFHEDYPLNDILQVTEVIIRTGNVAGIDIPVFENVRFIEKPYDYKYTPLWVDKGLEALKTLLTLTLKENVLMKQKELIRAELTTTTQRVNLFEKVKIPQTRDHIKKISIYLGDMQTAAVVTGKIAKAKIQDNRVLQEVEL
ncbi:MAG: V-type ATP synthase subunit D [Candidatus Margulisbacteria bacterium]|nr:V-type ATP synthase subunit D [Candidatus Margulisiibacteriota bacterium]